MAVCHLRSVRRLAPCPVETTRGDGPASAERTDVKKSKEHVIWMTRKMPVRVLDRMRVLSAHMSSGKAKRVPMWKIHQLALVEGIKVLEKGQGVPKR
jgi:hypothetical protein